MKVVLTGASGFIGQELVPRLEEAGISVLLVGRDKGRLARLFPGRRLADYTRLPERAKGYDALVHLAVLNSDQQGNLEDFHKVNVALLRETIAAVRSAEIPLFIYPSTIHTITQTDSPYARTKSAAEAVLAGETGLKTVILRLPAVHGATFAGRLALLNRLPRRLRPFVFKVLAAFRPTVHADKVAEAVIEALSTGQPKEKMVSDGQFDNPFYHFAKRAIDLGFALFVLLFLWWLLVAVWLLIMLSSRGPGLFAQPRVGKDGRLFTCYKFRTMQVGTPQRGTHDIAPAAITGIGRLLRQTKIDELPQVWNILRNELTLVGPRPCLPSQEALIDARAALGVLRVKPGLTGWAQIKGVDMRDPKRLARLDAEYVALRSLILDLRIVIATAFGRERVGEKENSVHRSP